VFFHSTADGHWRPIGRRPRALWRLSAIGPAGLPPSTLTALERARALLPEVRLARRRALAEPEEELARVEAAAYEEAAHAARIQALDADRRRRREAEELLLAEGEAAARAGSRLHDRAGRRPGTTPARRSGAGANSCVGGKRASVRRRGCSRALKQQIPRRRHAGARPKPPRPEKRGLIPPIAATNERPRWNAEAQPSLDGTLIELRPGRRKGRRGKTVFLGGAFAAFAFDGSQSIFASARCLPAPARWRFPGSS
jgi:hypothetical protein